jgi:hypothetical protein
LENSGALDSVSLLIRRVEALEAGLSVVICALSLLPSVFAPVPSPPRESPASPQSGAVGPSDNTERLRTDLSVLKTWTWPRFDSAIISTDPAVLIPFLDMTDNLWTKRFQLLWRCSHDGFRAGEFHHRCDGHGNTLTLILDRQWDIFRGFTPVPWEPNTPQLGDPSLESFVFILKSARTLGYAGRRFKPKRELSHELLRSSATHGRSLFGIFVNDSWERPRGVGSQLSRYCMDVAAGSWEIFTGSSDFDVKETKVFEITR